ncbi:MAG: YggT family protein [Actinobacteria bacterium]|nr:YggT family protein [Actinomycetota bacterium]
MITSWVQIPVNRVTEPIMRFIYDITEPILGLLRNVLPPVMVGGMGLDLSPLVAFLLLRLLRSLVYMVFGFLS